MFEKFTDKAIKVMMLAQEEARRFKYNRIGTDFIFLGLIAEETGVAAKILQSQGIKLKQARQELTKIIGIGTDTVGEEIPFSLRSRELLDRVFSMAEQLGSPSIDTEHLLIGILQDKEGIAVKILLPILKINCLDLIQALTAYNPNFAEELQKQWPIEVYVLLYNVGTDNEGIHTISKEEQHTILLFESSKDAEIFAQQLEGYNFTVPTVKKITFDVIIGFCQQLGYSFEWVKEGENRTSLSKSHPVFKQDLEEKVESFQPQFHWLTDAQRYHIIYTLIQTQAKGNQQKIDLVIAKFRDYFDERFLEILQEWFKNIKSQATGDQVRYNDRLAYLLESACLSILEHPEGCRLQDVAVVIAGLQCVLTISNHNTEEYADTLHNLGLAYYHLAKIGKNSESNLNQAIEFYTEAVKIYRSLNLEHAQTLHNLGLAYHDLAKFGKNSESNLNQAIEIYKEAAQIRRILNSEQYLSETLNNLGVAYYDLAKIGKNSESNLNQAIEFYTEAVKSCQSLNIEHDLADTLHNLGNAYFKLAQIDNNSESNFNQAIEFFKEATKIYGNLNLENNLANTLNHLGSVYLKLAPISSNRKSNLKQAIEIYTEAAQIYRKLNLEEDLSTILYNLAIVYDGLATLGNNIISNLNQALALYEEAKQIYQKLNVERDLVNTLHNLGTDYSVLAKIGVNSESNFSQAIENYLAAAQICRKLNLESNLSFTLTSLGIVFRNLANISSNRKGNLSQAIEFLTESEKICRKLNLEPNLSTTLTSLGIVYSDLAAIGSNRESNLSQAIKFLRESEKICRKLNLEYDLYFALSNLGVTYSGLAEIGSNSESNLNQAISIYIESGQILRKLNLFNELPYSLNSLGLAYQNKGDSQKAIETYREALVILEKIDLLIVARITGTNLGDLAFKQGKWETALEGYTVAIKAVEKMRTTLKSDQKRQELQESALSIYNNALQCYINLGQYDNAILLTERNRCRHLVELMYSNDLYKYGEIPPDIQAYLTQYETLQHQINLLQEQAKNDDGTKGVVSPTKSMITKFDQELGAKMKELQQEKQQIWLKLRELDKVLADGLEVPPFEITQLYKLIKNQPKTALISFYTVKDCTYILILRYPDVNTSVTNLLQSNLSDNSDELTPQVSLHPCNKATRTDLQGKIAENWFIPYTVREYYAGMDATAFILAIDKNEIDTLEMDEKEIAIQITLKDGTKKQITSEDWDEWEYYYKIYKERYFDEWMAKIPENLAYISDILEIDTLINTHLQNIEELIIIPHIYLHLIPFSALPINSPSSQVKSTQSPPFQDELEGISHLGDKFRLRILPSAQILEYCQEREEKEPNPPLNGENYGTVEDATDDLVMAKYECDNIVNFLDIPNKNRLQGKKQATYDNYIQLVHTPSIRSIHSSHHASSNISEPLESGLILGDKPLKLSQLLSLSVRMPQMLEIFLSCCETNVGSPNLTDDILTLGMGFLRAGARAVISTLWAVDDLATAFFCLFYYQNRQNGLNRSVSIQTAQRQLRQLTGEALLRDYLPPVEEAYEMAQKNLETATQAYNQVSIIYEEAKDNDIAFNQAYNEADKQRTQARRKCQEIKKKLGKDHPDYQYWQKEVEKWETIRDNLDISDIALIERVKSSRQAVKDGTKQVKWLKSVQDSIISYAKQDLPFDNPYYWSAFIIQGIN